MDVLPLIGYFPKKIEVRPEGLNASNVIEICSVSDCISKGPDDWIKHWKHNEMWVFSSETDALSVVPESQRSEFELLAYRMLPAVFNSGIKQPFDLPPIDVELLPANYQSLGFDAVSRSQYSSFEHSPLSCNYMAQEIETNEYCLLATPEIAEQAAMRFSIEEPEPGLYYVVEVLRRARANE